MAIMNITKKGEEVLTKKCREVTQFDDKLHVLLDDMFDTMEEANGVGIAAPQIGILRRIALVYDIDNEEIIELINPVITSKSGSQREVEGCLSMPGIFGYVTRPMIVTVKAQDRFGDFYEVTGEEFLARALCHEIDHLDGKLFEELVEEYIDPSEVE